MIFKIKEIFLLIFLILLQSCSGGKIGNFLESSFDNLETPNLNQKSKTFSVKKRVLDSEKKEIKKNIFKEETKGENYKIVLDDKKGLNLEKKESKKKSFKGEKNGENFKIVLDDKKEFNIKKKSDKRVRIRKENKSTNKRKNGLQSYKIIFILKDVDPKDPIKEFSTILNNSEVNFEIEKIERFFDKKNNIFKNNQ